MVSMYHGIETGRRAIEYFKKNMELSGINTTNMGKDGYSRQVAKTEATPALHVASRIGMLGTGVRITEIKRMRDLFLDAQKRRISTEQTYWNTLLGGVERVEKFMVNENNKGLDDLLDSFWGSLQEVMKNPSDGAVRKAFLLDADNLSSFTENLHARYSAYRTELNLDVKAMVEDANSYIDQIAVITRGIRSVRMAGGEPNELLDQRDLLVDKLCKLTGAEAGTSVDELDGDYKIHINGKSIVQGTQTRHLVLVKNPANENHYEVQIEDNLYDISSDPRVAQAIIERRADDMRSVNGSCTMDGTHNLNVRRLADGRYWTVGYGKGQSEGGARIDGIRDKDVKLNIDGSFSLQVGSKGIRAYSEVYSKTPPGAGNVLGKPGPEEPLSHSFRIAAGDFESTIKIEWDDALGRWNLSDNLGNTANTVADALPVSFLAEFLNDHYATEGIATTTEGNALVVESTDRHMLSITDLSGNLMRTAGLANENPIVRIDVTTDDSLQTIANKINNAYMFDRMKVTTVESGGTEETTGSLLSYSTIPPDTAPSAPGQWLHASVEKDANGDWFLCLISNLAGESHRINVLSGSVCGGEMKDMTIARRLGLVDDATPVHTDTTSYIQLDRENDRIVDRDTPNGDVYVDDAWIQFDDGEFVSSTNEFKSARRVIEVGNASARELEEVSRGIRLFLQGRGETTLLVRHPLTRGEIFAHIKLRDDVLLSQTDSFDDMTYKLASEFNAIHRASYGIEEYETITGLAFFEEIKGEYGAFGKFAMDKDALFDPNRFAAATGDGKGHSVGCGDGTGALTMARLKQAKLFMKGTADFNDLYKDFIADLGAFGERAKETLKTQNYIAEQVEVQRKSIMGVNSNEEMLNIVEMTQNFNKASQYIATLMQVIDKIITGVGRVGL